MKQPEGNNQTTGLFDIDPEEILRDARKKGLKVREIKDFRNETIDYELIDDLMNTYTTQFARYSAIGGATSGLGGIGTSIAFSSLEIISMAIQLYRLSQRFAVLNGFDPQHPLHREKTHNIYFKALGIKTASQAALKFAFFSVSKYQMNISASQKIASSLAKRLIKRVRKSGKYTIFIPVIGGAVGAYSSYTFAESTAKSMRDAFKEYYQSEWQ